MLVFHDLVGFYDVSFKPRFLKRYATVRDQMIEAIAAYTREVRKGEFPSEEHCYDTKTEPLASAC